MKYLKLLGATALFGVLLLVVYVVHVRYVPVLEGDTLLGVISFHDVAKSVLEEKSFENRMLKAYIKDWPEKSA